jgi:hypothetical protein
MRTILTTLSMVFAPLALCADEKKEEQPADLPVKAKLVAKTTTYKLDLGGKTADEFRAFLKENLGTGKLPPAPAVEITLELTNTSDKDVQIWTRGDPVTVTLELKGPGADTVTPRQAFSRICHVPMPMTLAPGKTFSVPIMSLAHGFRGISQRTYWTAPGDYKLTANFNTGISPAPLGTKPDPNGFGKAVVRSEPIDIKVEAK